MSNPDLEALQEAMRNAEKEPLVPVMPPPDQRWEDSIAIAIHGMPGVRLLAMCIDMVGPSNGPHCANKMFDWHLRQLKHL